MKHLKRLNSNYDFTVKQRLLAKEAKTANNIQELEDLVSLLLCYLNLWPKLVMQLDKMLEMGYRKDDSYVRLNPDLFIGW